MKINYKSLYDKLSVYKIIDKINNSRPIKSVLIVAVIVGSFITIGNFFYTTYGFYKLHIEVTNRISEVVNSLSPGQSINYFRKILGGEITSRIVNNNYKELFFKYETTYIQTVINNEDTVIFLSITDCSRPVKIVSPSFKTAYSGNQQIYPDFIILNNSTFPDFFRMSREEKKYFFSGATANSYYYEYEYGANPGGYQTFFVGLNDICYRFYLDDEATTLSEFRQAKKITTYGETAPFEGSKIIELLTNSSIYLGPDRVKFRVIKE